MNYPTDFTSEDTAIISLIRQNHKITDEEKTKIVMILNHCFHYFVVITDKDTITVMDSYAWNSSNPREIKLALNELRQLSNHESLDFGEALDNPIKQRIRRILQSVRYKPSFDGEKSLKNATPDCKAQILSKIFTQSNTWSCGLNSIANVLIFFGFWSFSSEASTTMAELEAPKPKTRISCQQLANDNKITENKRYISIKYILYLILSRHTSTIDLKVSKDVSYDQTVSDKNRG